MNFYNNSICYCRRCNGIIHVVEPGDTLYKLTRKYNVSLENIMNANPYVNVYNLQIGQRLCIPVMRPQPRNDSAGEGIQGMMQGSMQGMRTDNVADSDENMNVSSEEIVQDIKSEVKETEAEKWMNEGLPQGFYDDINE